jgi:hypothetical protein
VVLDAWPRAPFQRRAWSALRRLDEETIDEETRPAVDAPRALPPGPSRRRMTADLVVLRC